ncbi:2869_t:CDS:2 [Ambispora gerdemannii]|uniref:2869_t:CDS:1 n=1 Tax=Ambispora gerdemannii TaxID=144530 RepID=A0A9N9FMV2_9GLOM|nr:2869_t:CDS:2 [Ambispora gerdemannii]
MSQKKGHDTSFRRTWDKQEYEQCTRDRARREQQLEEEEERKSKGLRWFKALVLPRKYCKVCDCVVKDSVNYLDHINGKRAYLFHAYQRALDRTMKVERNTLDQVQNDWLVSSKKQKEEKPQEYDFEASVEQMRQQEEEEKQNRKGPRNLKRKMLLQTMMNKVGIIIF